MTTFPSRLRTAALAACGAALALAPAALGANRTGADLRVVDSNGRTLAEHHQYTGKTRVKTSPRADCFGAGNEGSGRRYRLPDASALSIVKDALRAQRRLRPLLLTDAFYDDGFGLGVCAIGGSSEPSGFWYLKRNHTGSTVSGDQTLIDAGDYVVWYLIEDFTDPTPEELVLKAPARVRAGQEIPVRVLSYDDGGSRSPAAGVTIKGAGVTTDAKGRAEVPTSGKRTRLQAVGANAIPSNVLKVCSKPKLRRCPSRHMSQIRGTNRRDRMRSGRGPARINAYGGRDVVNVRRARNRDRPVVNCGGGRDKVVARRGQRLGATRSCERIKRV